MEIESTGLLPRQGSWLDILDHTAAFAAGVILTIVVLGLVSRYLARKKSRNPEKRPHS